MKTLIKKMASYFPIAIQQELKRLNFGLQLRLGGFTSGEEEFALLSKWLHQGDWVVDIGANVGHYTIRCANLVGPAGRVLAFEPVPATFELLAANVRKAAVHHNVALVNAAASDTTRLVCMQLPQFSTGLTNFYQASISTDETGLSALAIRLDSLDFPHKIALIKIDVEGHELPTLIGLRAILARDRPILIVEGFSSEVEIFLKDLGYAFVHHGASPNRVYFISETSCQAV